MSLPGDSSGRLPADPHEAQPALSPGGEPPEARRARLLCSDHFGNSIRKVARNTGVAEHDIEDVVQETLARGLEIELPEDDERARRYVNGIAANVARDHLGEVVAEAADSYVEEHEEGGPAATPYWDAPANFEDRDLARQVVDATKKRFPRTFSWLLRARVMDETGAEIANDNVVQSSHVRHEISRVQRFARSAGQRLGAGLAVLVFVAIGLASWLRRPFEALDLSTYEARRAELPPPDADSLRARGTEACRALEWQACLDDLDAADRLDPAGAEGASEWRRAAERHLRIKDRAPLPYDPKGPQDSKAPQDQ